MIKLNNITKIFTLPDKKLTALDNVSLHAPVCPFMRFTPHFLGHRWQLSSNFLSFIIPDLSITDTIHIFHYLDVFFNHIFIYITDSIYRLL